MGTLLYAFEHAPTGMAITSFAPGSLGRIDHVNRAFCAMTGYGRRELIGSRLGELLHPEDLGDWASVVEPLLEDEIDSHRAECRCLTADGRELWVALSVSLMRDDLGRPVYLLVQMQDISERRRAEAYREAHLAVTTALAEAAGLEDAFASVLAALGETLDCAVGAFWSVDEEAGCLRCRAVWRADGHGFERFEERSLAATFRPGEGLPGRVWESGEPAIQDALCAPILSGGRVVGALELHSRERTAPEFDLLEFLETIGRQVGQFVERKEAEREADRLKDEFFALVSHELRTPLTSILGYVELALEDAERLHPELAQRLRVVERNGERLLRVVGDLLFVAQVEAGKLALDRGRADLDALAADAVEAARPRAEEQEIELVLESAGAPALAGDAGRLGQMLDNLISNALKFTPPGGRVTVAVGARPAAATVEVRDTGIGIDGEEQGRLFDRFFRGAAADGGAIPGVGLGLTIVKSIVEGHGGTIEVASEPGAGTTFRVELPLGDQEPAGQLHSALGP
jgi:PAS domain S-box-containing protein